MLKLIINPDTESSWELPLPPGSHVLGSDPSKSSLLIDHPSVAPQHCEIIAESDAAHFSDLASGMGSLVEGQAVTDQLINPGQRSDLSKRVKSGLEEEEYQIRERDGNRGSVR